MSQVKCNICTIWIIFFNLFSELSFSRIRLITYLSVLRTQQLQPKFKELGSHFSTSSDLNSGKKFGLKADISDTGSGDGRQLRVCWGWDTGPGSEESRGRAQRGDSPVTEKPSGGHKNIWSKKYKGRKIVSGSDGGDYRSWLLCQKFGRRSLMELGESGTLGLRDLIWLQFCSLMDPMIHVLRKMGFVHI